MKGYILFAVFFSVLLLSCEADRDNLKLWRQKSNHSCYIKFENDTVKNIVTFFDGSPNLTNFLKGEIREENKMIIFNSIQDTSLRFVLFDFNLKVNDCRMISYRKGNDTKTYLLCKQDVFYDKTENDTIYKFCFDKYNVFTQNTSVVYFVGIKNGVLGCYLMYYRDVDNAISISKRIGNTFENRYDYGKYHSFDIE